MLDPASRTPELPIIALSDPYHDSAYVVVDRDGLRHVELERHTRSKYEVLNALVGAWMLDRETLQNARTYLFHEGDYIAPLLRQMASGAAIDWHREIERLIRKQHGSMNADELLAMPALVDDVANVFRRMQGGDADWQVMDHHFCHAANAFLSTDFAEALVFTLDGGGAHFVDGRQVDVHGSVYRFDRSARLNREALHLVTDWSPGWAWTRVPRALGFDWCDAGTVMAMAAFGQASPGLRRRVRRNAVWDVDQSTVSVLRRTAIRLAGRSLHKIATDDASRFGLAAALQEETERRIRQFMAPYLNRTEPIDVCLSGGVFLNCVAVGKIKQWFPQVRRLYIPPAPYDGGLPIGLAQVFLFDQGLDESGSRERLAPFATAKAHHLPAVEAACRLAGIAPPAPTTVEEVAQRLGRGQIVAIFQGGSESGRRALGNRSILSDPRDPAKKDILNRIVKKRQWFRPFAPMILHEEVANWFAVWDGFESPYMSFAVPFLRGKGELVPAVLHADGTARVQTVHRDLTPKTHELLQAWHRHSDVPILLNTSFNDSEPIVETPDEAIATMLRSGIDGIYFADFDLFAANPGRVKA